MSLMHLIGVWVQVCGMGLLIWHILKSFKFFREKTRENYEMMERLQYKNGTLEAKVEICESSIFNMTKLITEQQIALQSHSKGLIDLQEQFSRLKHIEGVRRGYHQKRPQ